jgi:hypothetical protein
LARPDRALGGERRLQPTVAAVASKARLAGCGLSDLVVLWIQKGRPGALPLRLHLGQQGVGQGIRDLLPIPGRLLYCGRLWRMQAK